MKNILLKVICALALTFGTSNVSKAQLVHIPDANFRAYINIFFPGCMVGDSINPTCPAVLAVKKIDVSNRGITNLSGIEVFVNDTLLYCQLNLLTSLPNLPQSLTYLYCGANPLNSIPNLPPSLIYFHCGSSSLTSLPTLPSSLIELQCSDNQLTSLPTLPSSLAILECSGNQLTSLPNLPATLNFLRCTSNQLTSLPNSPTSLTEIHCNSNQLTSLPNLPMTLIHLFCNNNQLTSIPTLPASLTRLYCRGNQLTSLSTLSTSLFDLDCSYNQLTTLSNLPASLTNLYCDYNQLAYLPNLPSSLTNLDCIFNQLTSLPALPASLTSLNCIYNQLTSLPALPASLTSLNCHFNQLTSLPALPASLTNFFCHNNLLTSIPTLPASLTRLDCYNNQLTSLPGLASLIELNCHFNQLTSLPGLASLNYLSCSNNQLTSLPALPASLTSLFCSNNQLTSLPSLSASLINLDCSFNQLTSLPTLSGSLISLYCSHNQLTAIPILPDSLTFLNCRNNPLLCLPDLNQITYLNFFSTQINCLPGYGMLQTSYPDFFGFPLCDVFNTNGCDIFWNIEGSTFIDTDTNCNLGSSEPFLKNQKLNLYKNGVLDQQTYSNSNGDYDFDTFSFDFYETEFDTTGLPFEVHCPSPGFYMDTISAVDSMKYDRDFGLKCKDVDLAVTSIFSNNLRPASIREIKIQAGDYSNNFGAHCAAGISGTVNITITGACSYFSPAIGALTPNSVIGNVLTYNIADFGLVSYDSSFNFNILVDTTAALGSQICIQVSISTPAAELNYNNNLLSQCFTVVGSFDPNDKTTFPNATLDISGDRWLTYLIRFQNTGTASAEHIYITDTLSASLDWSTFSLLSYSHQPLTQVYNDGLVKFSFPHINLPDSNSNELASHGYVQYKIRAKDSLAIGSTIENTANIFFDFNAPVITNTTSNTVINCSMPPTIITASICNGDAYSLNGVLYYNDGTYQQKLITSVGCDSIIELQLTVSSIINTVSQSSAILQTTASGSSYQWIDCGNDTAINGATNSTFQPTQSGSYAVAVTYGNCIDTSACYTFSTVGLPSSITADIIFQTRYVSSSENILLHAEKLRGTHGQLRLMDLSGRIIYQQPTHEITAGKLNLEIPAKGLNAGIYIVSLITEKDNISGKVVKY